MPGQTRVIYGMCVSAPAVVWGPARPQWGETAPVSRRGLPADSPESIVVPWSSACRRRSRLASSGSRSLPPAPERSPKPDTACWWRRAPAPVAASATRNTWPPAPRSADTAELVLEVKEPLAKEVLRIREGQALFTYLHLAPMPGLVRALQARGVIAIAYETVERIDGSLPLLTPMSEVAGRLAVQEGAHYLGCAYGGPRDPAIGCARRAPRQRSDPGRRHGRAQRPRKTALGLCADVSLLDVNLDRLRHADDLFGGRVVTLASMIFRHRRVAVHGPQRSRRILR